MPQCDSKARVDSCFPSCCSLSVFSNHFYPYMPSEPILVIDKYQIYLFEVQRYSKLGNEPFYFVEYVPTPLRNIDY